MLHSHTQKLLTYWRRLRADRLAPRKVEIDPRQIKDHLAFSFLLQRDGEDRFTFRLAGTGLCELFGQELKGKNFVQFWADPSRSAARTSLVRVANLSVPTVAVCVAETGDLRPMRGELILLPFDGGADGTLLLGHFQPLEPLSKLGGKSLVRMRMTASAILTGDSNNSPEVEFERVPDAKAARHLKVVASR